MCVRLGGYVPVSAVAHGGQKRGSGLLDLDLTDGCELLDVGAGN